MRVALVSVEPSGDLLGAQVMSQFPGASFIGVGGPLMQAAGLQPITEQHELSVMGFVEPLLAAPRLVRNFRKLIRSINAFHPDVLVTIDGPDFNMRLAPKVKAKHKAHVVSPSVWAWRAGRAAKIAGIYNSLLSLFPFEYKYYPADFNVHCIGHPLAQRARSTRAELLAKYSIPEGEYLALIPGSRKQELTRLAPIYADVARSLGMPVVWASAHTWAEDYLSQFDLGVPTYFVDGAASAATIAAKALVTSGTATLEVALTQTPLVVAYKASALNYAIAKRVVKTKHISLPNILLEQGVVPEFIQNFTAQDLINALNNLNEAEQVDKFSGLAASLNDSKIEEWAKGVKNELDCRS